MRDEDSATGLVMLLDQLEMRLKECASRITKDRTYTMNRSPNPRIAGQQIELGFRNQRMRLKASVLGYRGIILGERNDYTEAMAFQFATDGDHRIHVSSRAGRGDDCDGLVGGCLTCDWLTIG